MASGKLLSVNKIVLILITPFFLLGCNKKTNKISEEIEQTDSISSAVFINRDLIYRYGDGTFSNLFLETSKKEKLYSHGGIVYISNDSIYVIHSEASELTLIGGVKKEPLAIFLKNITKWGLYRIDTTEDVTNKIATVAMEYAVKETPFDFDFDASSDNKIYCTELLAIAINRAMNKAIVTESTGFINKPYYSVDDTYLLSNAKLIYQVLNNKVNFKQLEDSSQ